MTGYDTSNINIIYVLILMNEQKSHLITCLFFYLFVFLFTHLLINSNDIFFRFVTLAERV